VEEVRARLNCYLEFSMHRHILKLLELVLKKNKPVILFVMSLYNSGNVTTLVL
jgi:hypothetical protein